jgi:hypothetical protein
MSDPDQRNGMGENMDGRRGFGALLGAGILMLVSVGMASAAAPTYSISVTKTADPAAVPAEGGNVEFTVWVDNTGTGFFQVEVFNDSLGGCSLVYDSGDTDADGDLDANETWGFTCTVADVAPGTTNTVTVNACHDGSVSSCNNQSHNAQGNAEVTVGLCETDCVIPPTAPPTAPPTQAASPGSGSGGAEDTTPPSTDTLGIDRSGPNDGFWLLVAGLGALLGSLAVLRPTASRRHR